MYQEIMDLIKPWRDSLHSRMRRERRCQTQVWLTAPSLDRFEPLLAAMAEDEFCCATLSMSREGKGYVAELRCFPEDVVIAQRVFKGTVRSPLVNPEDPTLIDYPEWQEHERRWGKLNRWEKTA